MKKQMNKYLDDRIEAKVISKIVHNRLSIRKLYVKRHETNYPDLRRKHIQGVIKNLRTWNRIANIVADYSDNTEYFGVNGDKDCYTIYQAKKLSAL
tara:strand:+ start:588 stop:875 length:288 start_codon:yes stop_codon:yes gene_type:complete